MKTKRILALGARAILLVSATAAASVYTMKNKGDVLPSKVYSANPATPEVVTGYLAQPPPLPDCDDDNIVGTVVRGTVGGIVGNQVGGGKWVKGF
jgi:outer membrane lipoprotein SlyB